MAAKFDPTRKHMDVVIVGGSNGALMHGIMLRNMGHNVRIFEQHGSDRLDYGAGIGTGPYGKQFLSEYDQADYDMAFNLRGPTILNGENEVLSEGEHPLCLTSWTALHYRLRGLFDGLASSYCPSPPSHLIHQGRSEFITSRRTIGVSQSTDGSLAVVTEDTSTLSVSTYHADMVIDASGAYSHVRASVLPQVQPNYVGYVAWRGIVPESEVSLETLNVFEDRFVTFSAHDGTYFVGYMIPGKNGSLKPGERLVNWVWYTLATEEEVVRTVLMDSAGRSHRNSISRGSLDQKVWEDRRSLPSARTSKAFYELLCVTDQPFVSAIRESWCSKLSFYGGRLLLVGDAANLVRPHAGQSTNNAAMACMLLREVLQGRLSLTQWERQVLREGKQMRLFSQALGDTFLHGKFKGALAFARLWVENAGRRFGSLLSRVQHSISRLRAAELHSSLSPNVIR